MQREIKFRAWDNIEKKYFIPIYQNHKGILCDLLIGLDGDINMLTMEGVMAETNHRNRFILEQYTGVKDRFGNEIYDGDIVYIAGYGNYQVEWYFYELIDRVVTGNYDDIGGIIGNIHENPELLV